MHIYLRMILLKWLSYLPFRLLYLISDILYVMIYYIIRYRLDIIKKNLSIVFPELTEKERAKVIRGFYKNFSDIIVESIKAISIRQEEFERRVTHTNLSVLEETKRKGESVVVLATHQCNWEWMSLAAFVRFPYPCYGVYKPLQNKRTNNLMLKVRTRFGGTLVTPEKIIRVIASRRDEVKLIGLIADQRPFIGNPKLWTKMFGRDTAFHTGTEQVPKIANTVVFVSRMIRQKRGYYDVELIKIHEPPYPRDKGIISIIDKYSKQTEAIIRERPSDWLWSHDRWKYSKDEERPLFKRS